MVAIGGAKDIQESKTVKCRKVPENDTIRRNFGNGVQVVEGSNPLAQTNIPSIIK